MSTIAAQTLAMTLDTISSYLSLASKMDKYESMAIFRRFGDLNLLNLLSLKAKLQQLRTDFKAACVQEPPSPQEIHRVMVLHILYQYTRNKKKPKKASR
jgi:hypothetical protein